MKIKHFISWLTIVAVLYGGISAVNGTLVPFLWEMYSKISFIGFTIIFLFLHFMVSNPAPPIDDEERGNYPHEKGY